MSLNSTFMSCLFFVTVSTKPSDPLTNDTSNETIYDINLYITVPASIIVLGLILCLCYCLMCSGPSVPQTNAFQPVFVSNRNTPLVVSSQTSTHTEEVGDVNCRPTDPIGMTQINRQNRSHLNRFGNPIENSAQTVIQPTNADQRTKATVCQHQNQTSPYKMENPRPDLKDTPNLAKPTPHSSNATQSKARKSNSSGISESGESIDSIDSSEALEKSGGVRPLPAKRPNSKIQPIEPKGGRVLRSNSNMTSKDPQNPFGEY